ncbi:hypothetical protein V6N13_104871 [Hibiscus sabdariffa]
MANNSARYTMVSAKNKWEEQGFHLDDSLPNYGLEQFVYNRLHELGWFRFAQQPARANYNWALEFYTNNSAGEDNVMVRGRRVAANTATIKSILGLPNDDPSFYAMLGALEDEDYETIKDYLCQEGTAWNTTGRNPHSVSRTQLPPEAKLWNTFVKRNLLPTSHNQTVDRTRLVLIHTIITGYRVNVGEILAKELAAACSNDKGILAFPCLISALCRRAAVPTSPSDKYQAEKKGWTRAVYMRKMDVADATPSTWRCQLRLPAQIICRQPQPMRQDLPIQQQHHMPQPSQANQQPVHPKQCQLPATLYPAELLRLQTCQPAERAHQIHPRAPPLKHPIHSHLPNPNAQPEAPAAAHHSTNTPPIPSTNPSAQAGDTEEVHISSDDENDIFDWQTPRDHPPAPCPTQQQAAATSATHSPDPADVPILQSAPISAQPTMETHHRRKGKTTAGRVLTRSDQSSPEEEADHQPAQKRRRRHVITSDSDDDQSAAVPTSSADASLSFTF